MAAQHVPICQAGQGRGAGAGRGRRTHGSRGNGLSSREGGDATAQESKATHQDPARLDQSVLLGLTEKKNPAKEWC